VNENDILVFPHKAVARVRTAVPNTCSTFMEQPARGLQLFS